MPALRIRQAEGCDGDPYLAWDTVWSAIRPALLAVGINAPQTN